jgi:hypothetical protein
LSHEPFKLDEVELRALLSDEPPAEDDEETEPASDELRERIDCASGVCIPTSCRSVSFLDKRARQRRYDFELQNG